MTDRTWRLGYRPALDGLRGIAIVMVLVCHLLIERLAIGSAGVTVFFVLSGFLITSLLLQEHDQFGRISVKHFYARRGLRLLPALTVMCLVVTVVQLTLGVGRNAVREAAAVLLYGANWVSMGERLGPMQHAWSLAVEEQFYLAWPVVLFLVLRVAGTRAVFWIAVFGGAASALERVVLAASGWDSARIYLGTDTRADALLWGCALAVAMNGQSDRGTKSIAGALAVGGIIVTSAVVDGPVQVHLLMPFVVALLAVMCVWCIGQGPGPTWLTGRWLVYLGQRSYGIYLFHKPMDYAMERAGAPLWVSAPVVTVCVAIVVWVSWRYVEQPFLALRSNGKRSDGLGGQTPIRGSGAARDRPGPVPAQT